MVTTDNGNYTLSLEGAQTYVADVVFGSGDDTFTLNNAAAVLTGLVDGGGRITANTFTQTAGTLSPTLVLANFL